MNNDKVCWGLIILGTIMMAIGIWNDFNIFMLIAGVIVFLSSYFFLEEVIRKRVERREKRWKKKWKEKYSKNLEEKKNNNNI